MRLVCICCQGKAAIRGFTESLMHDAAQNFPHGQFQQVLCFLNYACFAYLSLEKLCGDNIFAWCGVEGGREGRAGGGATHGAIF